MLLRKKRVSWVKSFEDYVGFLDHIIMKSAEPLRQILYCNFYRYFSESQKEGFGYNRDSDGVVFALNASLLFAAIFETDVLTNVTNKTNVYKYLAQNSLSFMIMIYI